MKARAFKTLGGAATYAHNEGTDRIIKCGDLFVVQDSDSITELAILDLEHMGSWTYNGFINLGHLEKLGNGNWATPELSRRNHQILNRG